MWHLKDVAWWEFIVRASVVYLVVMALLRVGGKRQVGQMGMAQLVALLLISNAVQNAMNGNDGSITGGVILASVIMAWSFLFELITSRSRRFENLIQGRPTLLMRGGKLIRSAMDKEHLSTRELKVILRRQGIHDFKCIDHAIMESDGFVSVWKKGEKDDDGFEWAAERNDVY